MRWLAYLAAALGLLAVGLSAYPWRPTEPRPPGDPPAQRPPQAAATCTVGPSTGTIRVEGEGLSPEAKQALGEFFHELIEEALVQAIDRSLEEMFRKLRIADEMEAKLLGTAHNWGPDDVPDGPFVLAIHLVRPGDAARLPETVGLTGEGGKTIRFTRAIAAVDRPLAVMTVTHIAGERVIQRELFLTYGPDGEWRVSRPVEQRDRPKADR
jgi:hypothetical protein